MSFKASHLYAHITPRKARSVANMIRGKKIDEALTALEFCKKRAAWYFRAVLRSAVANAEEKDADVHNLYVAETSVDAGPVQKRWRPKDRGRAHPFRKRTSHLRVGLAERS